jgi:acyl carrier protein
MGKKETLTKIQEIICDKLLISIEAITLDSDIMYDLCCDILTFYQIMLDIEYELKIEIPFEVCEHFKTVNDVFTYVWEKKSAQLN